jgi:hypothetical protein
MIESSLKPWLITNGNATDFNWIKTLSYFDWAAVPIIKMACIYKGIEVIVDITHVND